MKKIKPPAHIENLKPYKNASHKVWEHIYAKNNGRLHHILKLDWNESTYTPHFIVDQMSRYMLHHKVKINWYPDVNNLQLLKKLSDYVGLPPKNIQYFNGSDSALEYITRLYLEPKQKVVVISPTYDNFRVYTQACGAIPVFFFHASPFEKDIGKLKSFLYLQNPKMVYLVNPNNPTGVLYSSKEIAYFLKKFPSVLFVIDEAYAEFCGTTCKHLVKKYPNLIITRTFTKAFGLGALRLGYVLADESVVEHLNKIRVGKGINTFAQIAGIIALDNIKYMKQYVRDVKSSKKLLLKELKRMGMDVKTTPANFILIKCKDPSAVVDLFEKHQVFIRNISHLPTMESYVRVTVGDVDATRKFLKVCREITKNYGSRFF